MVASCQGNFQNTPTTNLNTLDRYPPPPSPLSPTMFISSSSNPPGLNEPVSFCYTVIYCVSTSLEHNFFSIFFCVHSMFLVLFFSFSEMQIEQKLQSAFFSSHILCLYCNHSLPRNQPYKILKDYQTVDNLIIQFNIVCTYSDQS